MNHENSYLTVHVFMIGSIRDKFMAYVTETSTGAMPWKLLLQIGRPRQWILRICSRRRSTYSINDWNVWINAQYWFWGTHCMSRNKTMVYSNLPETMIFSGSLGIDGIFLLLCSKRFGYIWLGIRSFSLNFLNFIASWEGLEKGLATAAALAAAACAAAARSICLWCVWRPISTILLRAEIFWKLRYQREIKWSKTHFCIKIASITLTCISCCRLGYQIIEEKPLHLPIICICWKVIHHSLFSSRRRWSDILICIYHFRGQGAFATSRG